MGWVVNIATLGEGVMAVGAQAVALAQEIRDFTQDLTVILDVTRSHIKHQLGDRTITIPGEMFFPPANKMGFVFSISDFYFGIRRPRINPSPMTSAKPSSARHKMRLTVEGTPWRLMTEPFAYQRPLVQPAYVNN